MANRLHRRSILVVTSAALLAGFLALAGLAVPAGAATTTAWAGWSPLAGASTEYTTSVEFGTASGLVATVSSTSRSGQVGVISGASTWLSEGTPVGAKYGSSRDRPYLNLRPFADAARIPSITTYTFDSPTPASGWTFVLGDIDADMLQITAVTAAGTPATAAELGFQSGFNYCGPGVTGKPSCTGDALDVPSWDAATTTLTGNIAASDTSGAAAWFEPNTPLSSLTFTFTARSGFPIYQTWFASIARDIGGTVTDSGGLAEAGAAVELFDTNGESAATTTTDATGAYSFAGYTAADGYSVELTVPDGDAVIGQNPRSADISQTDALDVDFALRELQGATVSGQTLDTENAPVAGVVVELADAAGATVVETTDASGEFEFTSVPTGDYALTVEVPSGYVLRDAPEPFTVPENSEVPITGLDFTLAELSSIAGLVTVAGEPAAGIRVDVDGPNGEFSAPTDREGRYSVGDLATGQYSLTVTIPEDSYPLGDPTVRIAITEDGTDVIDGDFEFGREGSVSGAVVDSDGMPVAQASVEVAGPTGPTTLTTAFDGTYRIEGLINGDYLLTVVVPDGYEPVSPDSRAVTMTTFGESLTVEDFTLRLVGEVEPPIPSSPSVATTSSVLAATGGEFSSALLAVGVASILLGVLAMRTMQRRRFRA